MNFFQTLTTWLKTITQPVISYQTERAHFGSLHDFAKDAAGNAYFGSGNPADNYDTTRVFTKGLFGSKTLDTELGLKVHYRTSAETGDYQNGQYFVDGGHQQNGVHGASGDHTGRASTNVDFSVWKADGDFSTTKILIDTDSSTNEKFTVGTFTDMDNDGDIDAIVFDNGFVQGVGPGNGAEPGELVADSFNWYFMKDKIDGGAWNGESGQLEFRIVDTMDQPNPLFGFAEQDAVQAVTVNFGPMAEVIPLAA